MAASVNNYTLGKGIVYFKATGGSYVDMGNAPVFEFTPEVTTIEHYSSRAGIRSLDKTIVTEKKGTLRIVLDEITPENLAIAMLDDTYTTGAIEILGGSSVTGAVKLEMTNTVGRTYEIEFLQVEFRPNAAVSFIGEDLMTIELTATVQYNESEASFGTITDRVTA